MSDPIDLFAADQERAMLSQLLERSKLYHSSAEFKALLEFVARLRNFAPFNAMMLQIQKPGLRFAASETDWYQQFQRTVKEGARPLIVLWPFGPFSLVYDVADTEGPDLPEAVAAAFRASGNMTPKVLTDFLRRITKAGIHGAMIPYGDANAGHIQVLEPSPSNKVMGAYALRINSQHDPNVQFATLVHELGHLYLGHLGADPFLGIKGRRGLGHRQWELEAESLTFLVCARNGVASKSESYLADYVEKNAVAEQADVYSLMRAAGQIESLLGLDPKSRPVPTTAQASLF